MNTLTIKLKQHTPLIHFQHDQEGATLRASEVKPKLDKYILSKLSSEEKVQGQNDGWIKVKGDKTWLDYKIFIEAKEKDGFVRLNVKQKTDNRTRAIKYVTDEFPFLIANMGGKDTEDELMNFSLYNDVSMRIVTSQIRLCQLVDSNIEMFFAQNNFGQRQTKGFGSYSVIGKQINGDEMIEIGWSGHFKDYFENGTPVLKFSVNADLDSLKKQKMLFDVLDFYWRCLKSGINYTKRLVPKNGNGDVIIRNKERYIKAFLWTYLNSKGYTWEKRKIKRDLHLETPFPERNYGESASNAVFARGLMGCPDKYEYRIPQNTFREDRNRNQYKEIVENHTVRINNISQTIERISSPIIFKPIVEGNSVSVYILFYQELIDRLRSLPENQRVFSFSEGRNQVQISIVPESIDYTELIRKYHFYFFTNESFISSTLGEYVDRSWQPARIIVERDEQGKVVSRKWGNMSISWKMVPRNFAWENILDPSDNGKNHYVSFSQIVK